MLFAVRMDVSLPPGLAPAERGDILSREKAYSQELQRSGKWLHIWRIAGHYSNLSVFEVASNDELHDILSNLPLFAYLAITVTPLSAHPSAIDALTSHAREKNGVRPPLRSGHGAVL